MKDLIISFIAITPIAIVNAIVFDPRDWQFWAILGAGVWASTIGGLRN